MRGHQSFDAQRASAAQAAVGQARTETHEICADGGHQFQGDRQ
jgi:hypothetical protein